MGSFSLNAVRMRTTVVALISLVFFFGLAACQEEILPLSQGNCPHGWMDGSFVGLGCMLFNSTKGMDWIDSSIYCRNAYRNASLVEILTVEQMEFLIMELEFLETQ